MVSRRRPASRRSGPWTADSWSLRARRRSFRVTAPSSGGAARRRPAATEQHRPAERQRGHVRGIHVDRDEVRHGLGPVRHPHPEPYAPRLVRSLPPRRCPGGILQPALRRVPLVRQAVAVQILRVGRQLHFATIADGTWFARCRHRGHSGRVRFRVRFRVRVRVRFRVRGTIDARYLDPKGTVGDGIPGVITDIGRISPDPAVADRPAGASAVILAGAARDAQAPVGVVVVARYRYVYMVGGVGAERCAGRSRERVESITGERAGRGQRVEARGRFVAAVVGANAHFHRARGVAAALEVLCTQIDVHGCELVSAGLRTCREQLRDDVGVVQFRSLTGIRDEGRLCLCLQNRYGNRIGEPRTANASRRRRGRRTHKEHLLLDGRRAPRGKPGFPPISMIRTEDAPVDAREWPGRREVGVTRAVRGRGWRRALPGGSTGDAWARRRSRNGMPLPVRAPSSSSAWDGRAGSRGCSGGRDHRGRRGVARERGIRPTAGRTLRAVPRPQSTLCSASSWFPPERPGNTGATARGQGSPADARDFPQSVCHGKH